MNNNKCRCQSGRYKMLQNVRRSNSTVNKRCTTKIKLKKTHHFNVQYRPIYRCLEISHIHLPITASFPLTYFNYYLSRYFSSTVVCHKKSRSRRLKSDRWVFLIVVNNRETLLRTPSCRFLVQHLHTSTCRCRLTVSNIKWDEVAQCETGASTILCMVCRYVPRQHEMEIDTKMRRWESKGMTKFIFAIQVITWMLAHTKVKRTLTKREILREC